MASSPKTITTGKLPLDPRAWLAIMSLSLVVNLPGLAITPMLGTLDKIFPGTSDLERQLLTMLPNLLIIPFVLMSGKLSTTPRKKLLVLVALVIYVLSTIGYLFSHSMLELIIYSCTLGIGAGLLVPFSTGLLADTFSGKYLVRQMGLQSAVSNLTLVIATFAVGWLAIFNWHLPFLVYAVCLIPLALMPYLKKVPEQEMNPALSDKAPAASAVLDPSLKCNAKGLSISRLATVFGVYFLMCVATVSISEYTPFLVSHRHLDPSITGTITSVYFLLVFASGFYLDKICKIFKANTMIVACAFILIGLIIFTFLSSVGMMMVGTILCGFGYGVVQPVVYNKATQTVCRPSLSTQALAIALTANYAAIVAEPLITQGICKLFNQPVNSTFPFYISVVLALALFICAFVRPKSFAFKIDNSYYE